MNYRNRALLSLAYQIPCTLRIPCVCQGGMGEPAHSNQSRHGKGKSLKAHDVFFASACRACHREIDQGSTLARQQRIDYWQSGHELTLLALFEGGLVKVTFCGLASAAQDSVEYVPDGKPERPCFGQRRRRKSRCTRPEKRVARPAA